MKTLKSRFNDVRREAILEALRVTEGHRRNAAKMLGVSHSHFYYWMDKLELGGAETLANRRHIGSPHRRMFDREVA